MSLRDIKTSTPISELTPEEIRELQTLLASLYYPVGQIDGLFGPNTENAWKRFKEDRYQDFPSLIGPGSAKLLLEAKPPEIAYNAQLIPAIWAPKAKLYIPTLIKAFNDQQMPHDPKVYAYACASVGMESSWNPKAVNTTDAAAKTGYPGAGLAQVTWIDNYRKCSHDTGIDFLNHPEYMFDPYKSLRAKAAYYRYTGMLEYIIKSDYESAGGLYNAGKAHVRSDYTRRVARDTPKWIPVFTK